MSVSYQKGRKEKEETCRFLLAPENLMDSLGLFWLAAPASMVNNAKYTLSTDWCKSLLYGKWLHGERNQLKTKVEKEKPNKQNNSLDNFNHLFNDKKFGASCFSLNSCHKTVELLEYRWIVRDTRESMSQELQMRDDTKKLIRKVWVNKNKWWVTTLAMYSFNSGESSVAMRWIRYLKTKTSLRPNLISALMAI